MNAYTPIEEVDALRAENERLTSLAQIMGEERDRAWTEHLIERENLKAEIVELRGSKAALQVEIDRLRSLNDDQWEIIDGTERRESEYLALIEKHATENERLKAEHHTTKKMLEDILEKHGVGSSTPHYGLGRGGLKPVK